MERVDWDELPPSVQARAISVAAESVGSVPVAQLPSVVQPVARFTPAKRAQRGADLLTSALRTDAAFRALVAKNVKHAARPVDADEIVIAFLTGAAPPASLVRVSDADALATARRRVIELERTVAALTKRLARSEAAALQESSASADRAARADAEKFQQRLREQGVRLRRAQVALDESEQRAAAREAELQATLDAAIEANQAARVRAEKAEQAAEVATKSLAAQRESTHNAESAADRRIEVLLSALEGAASGLRREWNITAHGELPADVIAAQLSAKKLSTKATSSAAAIADGARLTDVLTAPGAHLIVDGYNVTKTGYPELSLTDQRDRLIRSLSSLSARTSAEVTVVFDGAVVTAAAPPGRKVRVLFSPSDVIADDVIRQLVGAEPAGRTVVVATSDRAVATDIAASGARPVASAVLLSVLMR